MRDYGDRDDERWRDDGDDDGPNRRGTWGQGPARSGWSQGGFRNDRRNQRRPGSGGGQGWNPSRAAWDHGESGFGGYAGYGGYEDDPGYGGYAENRGYSGDRDAYGGGYGSFAGGYGGGGRREAPGGSASGDRNRGGGWRGRYSGVGPKNYQRSDERIREDVNDRLTLADLDATEIEVEASQGIVTLRGSVENRGDKRHAEDIADSVPGVKDVHNELKIVQHAQSVTDKAKEAVGIHD